jgi:hypothetical protein
MDRLQRLLLLSAALQFGTLNTPALAARRLRQETLSAGDQWTIYGGSAVNKTCDFEWGDKSACKRVRVCPKVGEDQSGDNIYADPIQLQPCE